MHIEILQSPWLCELMALYINMRQGKTKNKAIVRLFGDCSLTFDDDGKPALSCGLFDSMKVEIDLTCSICLVSLLLLSLQRHCSFLQHSQIYSWTDAVSHLLPKLIVMILQDTVFDPVALTCGHLFCYMCCCSAASVTIVDGLKAASPKAKCPLCRHVQSLSQLSSANASKIECLDAVSYVPFQEGVHEGAVHLDELNILLSHRYSLLWWYVFSNCFRAARSFLTVCRGTAALITGRSEFGPKE